MRRRLERHFEFEALGTNWRTEILAGVTKQIVSAIPTELYSAIAAGIGLLLVLVGFRNSGIIVASPTTTVAPGNLRDSNTLLAVFGLLLIAALLAWRVRGAMLIGILATTLLKVLRGEFRKVNWLVYLLTALFIARFLYLGAG